MTRASDLRDDAKRSRRLAAAMPEDADRGALEQMAREFDRDAAREEIQDRKDDYEERLRAKD